MNPTINRIADELRIQTETRQAIEEEKLRAANIKLEATKNRNAEIRELVREWVSTLDLQQLECLAHSFNRLCVEFSWGLPDRFFHWPPRATGKYIPFLSLVDVEAPDMNGYPYSIYEKSDDPEWLFAYTAHAEAKRILSEAQRSLWELEV